jgi:hypothetical protein
MAAGVALKDLITFQELGKSRAEIGFKLDIERSKGADPAVISHYESKLASASRQLEEIALKMERAGIRLTLPNELELSRLNCELSAHPAKELADAMRQRSGPVWDALAARGALLRRNFEDRENIAKLSLLAAHLQKDVRDSLHEQVRKGSVSAAVPILKGEETVGRKVALVLGRLGMPAELKDGMLSPCANVAEIPVQLQNRRVWVLPEVRERLGENMKKLEMISPQIQVRNAVRHVKTFSEDEEKEFARIQNEYLKLLKEQDELLKDFDEEGNL